MIDGFIGRCGLWVLLLWLALLLPVAPAMAGERVALVIGNDAYRYGGALNHAVSDAKTVGDALQRLGFRVIPRNNLKYSDFLDALDELGKAAMGADWAVVYYAGHGIQVRGNNYLIPVDVGLNREGDLRRTVLLADLLTEVNQARELGLVILDACRDNPFAARLNRGAGRSLAGRGLARVEETGGNTLVAFATRENDIAVDTGVYAAALVKYLATPGLELRQLFGKVRDAVMARTGNTQQPFTYGSLGGGYYTFKPGPIRPPEANRDPEVVFWDSVKDSRNPAVFRIYLERYPNGMFAKLAQIRLKELEPTPPAPVKPLELPQLPSNLPSRLIDWPNPPRPPRPVETPVAERYRDNGDGTVTDVKTGLQWMRCSLGQTWRSGTCAGEALYMVRPAMQEGTYCAAEGAVAAIYPASSSGVVVAPRALMEFAGLPVLITLSVSTKLAGKFFRFAGRQDWPFMPSP